MSFKVIMLIASFMLVSETGGNLFKATYCKERGNDSVGVVFRNESTAKRLTIVGDEQRVMFKGPYGKGFISWKEIESLDYKRSAPSELGFLSVRLNSAGIDTVGVRQIEFGVMDDECWSLLKSKYGPQLNLLESGS